MKINEKLTALRGLMSAQGIDTYVITKFDPHQSEYSAPHWNGVRFISGFLGSAGTVVVTQAEAGLWTDGRYYIQAERDMAGSEMKLHKAGEQGVRDYMTFARDETPAGGCIGFDGKTLSLEQAKSLLKKIETKKITLKTDVDLVGDLWEDRPALSKNAIYDHDIAFCGKSRTEKIRELREKMEKEGVDALVLSSLDDLAWLFNLRGNDLQNITFFAAYGVISKEEAVLFVEEEKARNVRDVLENDGVWIKAYEAIHGYLRTLKPETKAMLDAKRTSYALSKDLEMCQTVERAPDFTTEMKAIKNETELENLEKVNIRDGAAMVRFIKWLKENVKTSQITEWDIDAKLTDFRKTGENYISPCFDTIAGYMSNAAMMHYSAKPDDCAVIKPEGMLLVDCGGHYLDGSTDITRTIVLGEISEQMRRDFTLVLQSHIGLARTVFLYGATGSNLDIMARMPMWINGLDYKCGTGHGVGFCLNVHEGPQSFSQTPNTAKLETGMIITNEPGIYRQDEYGIRTENTMRVAEHNETAFGRFLKFEVFSYCPIDREGIDPAMLTPEETEWLNSYHRTVYEKLSPVLPEEEREWLKEATEAIG